MIFDMIDFDFINVSLSFLVNSQDWFAHLESVDSIFKLSKDFITDTLFAKASLKFVSVNKDELTIGNHLVKFIFVAVYLSIYEVMWSEGGNEEPTNLKRCVEVIERWSRHVSLG